MSAPLSARDWIPLVLAVAVTGCNRTKAPEADPQKIVTLAATMLKNAPVPGEVRTCAYDEVLGGVTVTKRTLVELSKQEVPARPELAEFVNPHELDSPATRTLVESTDKTEQRRAAAELLAGAFWLVYQIDLVDQPIALGVKDFKRGNVGARALRYDKTGKLFCTLLFYWSNDDAKQEWAIAQSNKPLIDPAVKQAMQDDLKAQMLKRVSTLAAPPPPRKGPADDRHDRQ